MHEIIRLFVLVWGTGNALREVAVGFSEAELSIKENRAPFTSVDRGEILRMSSAATKLRQLSLEDQNIAAGRSSTGR